MGKLLDRVWGACVGRHRPAIDAARADDAAQVIAEPARWIGIGFVGLVAVATFAASQVLAFYLLGKLTYSKIDETRLPPIGFPVLVVNGDDSEVVWVKDLAAVPPLPAGASYRVPPERAEELESQIRAKDDPRRDSFWVLRVRGGSDTRQEVELYRMGDGWSGGSMKRRIASSFRSTGRAPAPASCSW